MFKNLFKWLWRPVANCYHVDQWGRTPAGLYHVLKSGPKKVERAYFTCCKCGQKYTIERGGRIVKIKID